MERHGRHWTQRFVGRASCPLSLVVFVFPWWLMVMDGVHMYIDTLSLILTLHLSLFHSPSLSHSLRLSLSPPLSHYHCLSPSLSPTLHLPHPHPLSPSLPDLTVPPREKGQKQSRKNGRKSVLRSHILHRIPRDA